MAGAGLPRAGRAWMLAALSAVPAASLLCPPGLLDALPEACLATRLGLPCAGHGLTHGFVALAHGRLADALRANPATPLVAAGLAWLWLGSLWGCLARGKRAD